MKVIVDSCVWLEFFRKKADTLEILLSKNHVLVHSIVIGELSCGNLKNRLKTLEDLKLLPRAQEASFSEVIELIEASHLYGKGLGFSDVSLLASALLTECALLSFDKAVSRAAEELGIAAVI